MAATEVFTSFDAQIDASCATRHATLATRNVKAFEHSGISLVDLWKSA